MNKNIKFLINYLLGPALFVFLCWMMYRQISKQPALAQSIEIISQSWKNPAIWLAFVLLFLNWGLESRKWQLLLAQIEEVSFFRAFKSVLTGVSVTLFTPNRVGEFAGRILFVNTGHRATAISLTILGSMAQLLVTLIFGFVGILIIRELPRFSSQDPYGVRLAAMDWVIIPATLVFSGLLAMFFFRIQSVVHRISGWRIFKGFVKYIQVLEAIPRKLLLRILFLSVIRYLVFILQYLLILKAFGAEVPWSGGFWILSVFYLLISGIPTVGFSELPLRAVASVEIFSLFTDNTVAVQGAAFGIWIINIAIPSLLGGLVLVGHKMYRDK